MEIISIPYGPTPGLSGEFIIWAAHPDVYDTIDQDRFAFYRVYVVPVLASIRSSKADTLNFQVTCIIREILPYRIYVSVPCLYSRLLRK